MEQSSTIIFLLLKFTLGFCLKIDGSFIQSIADNFHTHSDTYHVPEDWKNKNELLKNITYPGSVVIHSQYNISQIKPYDLHIFLQNDNFSKNSVSTLEQLFSARKNSNREVWMIDISDFYSLEMAKSTLQNLKLGLISLFEIISFSKDLGHFAAGEI